jgi:hypothetical protein
VIADRKDFAPLLEKRHGEANARLLPLARLVQGAAVVADKLKRTEEWERYCTYLQGMANKMVGARDTARAKMNDPTVLAHADLLKLKFDAAEADAMVRAWTMAIELPAAILAGGEEADKFIQEFDKKNETTGNAKP